ncbi:hypothetical protein ACFQ3L_05270 [Lacticaseibacillus jixianensis]|uniref:DUF3397 domain-containing protein n=1 Tax=Lacticaseibacillus jixianensis TaxID=2486012 RepID=A0ABW4B9E4_9LACO|nr:hypothetical protein [Lacticaseibacillus jixianensis]
MDTFIGIVIPILGLALWLVSRALQFHSRLLPFLAAGLELWGMATLSAAKAPNMIWVALFTATAMAVLLVGVFLARDYDLLYAKYFTTLGRLLILATTVWWVSAVLSSF